MAFGDGAIASVTEELSTDLLNELQVSNRLWNDFQEPQLQETINTLKRCTPLERAYFQRFFTFVSKEQILSKTGGKNDSSNGFAGLWHTPLAEKNRIGKYSARTDSHRKASKRTGKKDMILFWESVPLFSCLSAIWGW